MPARENLILMPSWTIWALYALTVVAFGIMAWGLWHRVRVYRMGRRAGRTAHWTVGLRRFAAQVLGQRRTARKRVAGPMHLMLFYGFVALLIGTSLVALDYDVFEPLGAKLLQGDFYLAFEVVLDLFGVALIVGVMVAAWRRTFVRPRALKTRPTDRTALWMLGVLGITGFLLEGLRLHLRPVPWGEWSVVGHGLAGLYDAVGVPRSEGSRGAYVALWWFHSLLTLGLIAMVPFTKMVHLFTTSANIALPEVARAPGHLAMPFDLRELMARDDIDEEALIIGADAPAKLTWRQLLMADACTNCGRCEEACPATDAGRPLSPRVLIQDVNHAAFAAARVPPAFGWQASAGPGAMGPDAWAAYEDAAEAAPANAPTLGTVIDEATLWSCVTCRNCEEACPVFIEHVGIIMDMRRHLTTEGRVSGHQRNLLKSVERHENPWGRTDRLAWTEGLAAQGVKVHEVSELGDAKSLDVVYWVGCAAASDPRNQQIARSLARILDAAGLRWAILGREEACTGDPARRLGEEGRFQELALQNIETFDRYAIKRVVASCPHCFNTLKNEYPDLGWAHAEVLHHTELIDRLVAEGRLRLEATPEVRSVAYHDSCYLGRHNRVFDAPRRVLQAIPGLEVREVEGRCRENGRCCGAGGANLWYEVEETRRINHQRLEELVGTGAAGVASNCPFCLIMFEDARLALAPETPTLDVAELVAASLPAAGDAAPPAPDEEAPAATAGR